VEALIKKFVFFRNTFAKDTEGAEAFGQETSKQSPKMEGQRHSGGNEEV
jgi:hypothetical protein